MPSLISVLEPVGLGDMMGDGGSGVERCGRSGESRSHRSAADGRRARRPQGCGPIRQLDYLTDERGGPLVSFIGRFERLEADLADVSRRLGVVLRLGHRNASSHAGYQDYYSRRTREIVAERFARDIEAFGYRF